MCAPVSHQARTRAMTSTRLTSSRTLCDRMRRAGEGAMTGLLAGATQYTLGGVAHRFVLGHIIRNRLIIQTSLFHTSCTTA
jgi:hypothetical protein